MTVWSISMFLRNVEIQVFHLIPRIDRGKGQTSMSHMLDFRWRRIFPNFAFWTFREQSFGPPSSVFHADSEKQHPVKTFDMTIRGWHANLVCCFYFPYVYLYIVYVCELRTLNSPLSNTLNSLWTLVRQNFCLCGLPASGTLRTPGVRHDFDSGQFCPSPKFW